MGRKLTDKNLKHEIPVMLPALLGTTAVNHRCEAELKGEASSIYRGGYNNGNSAGGFTVPEI